MESPQRAEPPRKDPPTTGASPKMKAIAASSTEVSPTMRPRSPLAAVSAPSSEQHSRRASAEGAVPPAQAATKIRLQELFQHWAALPQTEVILRSLVTDALHTIAPAPVESDDNGDGGERCTPDIAPPPGASPPTGASTNPRSAPSSAGSGGEQGPNGGAVKSPAGPAIPLLTGLVNGGRNQPSINVESDDGGSADLPALRDGDLGRTSSTSSMDPRRALSPVRSGRNSPSMRSPRTGPVNALSPNALGHHMVDELDAAHRMGALSPRTFAAAAAHPDNATPRSPLESVLRGSTRTSPSAVPQFSLEPSASPPVSEPNTPRHHPRSQPPLSARRIGSLSASSFPDLSSRKAVPVATAADIPRFYFPTGRPAQVAESLADVVEANAKEKEKQDKDKDAKDKEGKVDPQEAAAQAEEEQEIAALNAAYTHLQSTAKRPSGRVPSAGRRPSTTAAPSPQAIAQCMTKITADAFKLPSVLVPMVAAKISGRGVGPAKAFYDQFMARRSHDRRIFEVLLGSHPTCSALEPEPGSKKGKHDKKEKKEKKERKDEEGKRRNYLVRDDFRPLLTALLDQHPGLNFLKDAADFQSKYVDTVLARIFYDLDVLDVGRISWQEFERSALPAAIRQVSTTDDINTVLNFFSYEHFYVLYCRFWELDTDKDMLLGPDDLERYYIEGTACPPIIQRIFDGVPRRLTAAKGKMNYDDFVWFCLSEEDKSSPRALRYWFRLLDMDGDGTVSGYELNDFYEHTRSRLEQAASETVAFSDVMCQVVDMLTGAVSAEEECDSPHEDDGAPPQRPATASMSPGRTPPRPRESSGKDRPPPASGMSGTPLSGFDLLRRAVSRTGPGGSASTARGRTVHHDATSPAGPTSRSSSPGGSNRTSPRVPLPRPSTPGSLGGSLLGAPLTLDEKRDAMRLGFTLADLLRAPFAASVALNMVTNVAKFLQFEQRDPFVVNQERMNGAIERTEWDRFCRAEYDRMSASEDGEFA